MTLITRQLDNLIILSIFKEADGADELLIGLG
jgi:hypothetical protein